jgi:hypothetical protein
MKKSPCRSERPHSHVAIIDKALANVEECYCEFIKTKVDIGSA